MNEVKETTSKLNNYWRDNTNKLIKLENPQQIGKAKSVTTLNSVDLIIA